MKTINNIRWASLLFLIGISCAWAEERVLELDITTVIGSEENVLTLPGSGAYLDTQDLRLQSYDDINRVLRKVPGVYVREEDGYGLFPNISLRGVDTNRSSKVTIMEDGVLTAPAPYSAPSAYYSPTTGRMHGIEVLKGSSQVQYGPHTTGGVVNYISTPIPEEPSGYLKFLFGTDDEMRVHTYYGGHYDTDAGRIGVLFEMYSRTTDGFKEIDSVAGSNIDSDDTGFENYEPMLKLSWEPKTDKYQRFELKLGYTDRDANETYLGLTDADFDDDPTRRYAASRFDEINTYQTRSYLRHYIELSDTVSTETTAYYNRFHRNWYKLHQLRGAYTADSGAALNNPSLSASIAQGGTALAALQGTGAGTLRVRANNRDYYGYGLQNVTNIELENHELTLGVRYHIDRIRRFQWNDDYTQDATGAITNIAYQVGGAGAAGNRRQQTDAIAVFAEDEITMGALTITPGVRFERLRLSHDRIDNGTAGTDRLSVWAAGIGMNYEMNGETNIFGGIHRGVSTPGPRAHIANEIDEETSIAYELGVRYNNDEGLSGEIALFHTSLEDLFVDGNIGGSGTGNSDNAGDIVSMGLELLIEYDAGVANGWGFSNPYFASVTITNAELDGDANSTDPESIFFGGEDGNEVPYIPDYQFTIGTGLAFEKWGVELLGTYVDETFTTADNVDGSTTDARVGKTDSYFVVDLSAWYQLNETTKLTGSLRNLFDEEYIVSRLPHGPRPGRPFSAIAGIEITF